ncbi:MAG: hypothetical protein KF814_06520 [Nitrospiraceae bacterium]|nr:hypothetical protein [Nitrospiraceae bacterium]
MATLGRVLLGAVTGYLVGFFGGMLLIQLLSSNTHDKSLEAAMTGAFVIGPACALLSGIIALMVRSGRTHAPAGRS